MTRNIWVGIIVVIVLIAGGWWYLNQSSAPATSEATQFPTTQTEQQNTTNNAQPVANNQTTQQPQTNTLPKPAQTQPSTGAGMKEYVNSEYRISFSHPNSWQCKTSRPDSGHPDWNQTICDDGGVYSGDPLVGISVPFVAEDKDIWSKIRESKITGQNSSVITKTVYRSAGSGGSIGLVEYIFSGSATMKSYSLFALYGTGKPYATAEETEGVLDHIVQSLVVNQMKKLPASRTSGLAPLEVRFSMAGVIPVGEMGDVSSFVIDFGDSKTERGTSFFCFETQCIIDHTYFSPGTYNAELYKPGPVASTPRSGAISYGTETIVVSQ